MANPVATQVVTAAIKSQRTEEFAGYLIQYFLIGPPPPAELRVLTGSQYVRFMQAMGERGDLNAGLSYLGGISDYLDPRGQSYVHLVAAGMSLAGRALNMSCGFYMEAVKVPVSEPDDVWWAVHAGILGLCIWVARIPPKSTKSLGESPNGLSLNELVSYLGTYAKFTSEALEQPVLEPRRDLLRVFAAASDALYRAVELRPNRIGPLRRMVQEALESEGVSIPHGRGRSRAQAQAEMVDSLTDGQWGFQEAVTEIEAMWSKAYDES